MINYEYITLISIIITLMILCYLYDEYVLSNSCKTIYNSIDNDNDINMANQYINYATSKYNKTPIDNYRIANIYDFVLHDTKNANNYYKKSINQIKQNPAFDNNYFIKDRIRDRIIINNKSEIDDNKFNINDLNEIEMELNDLEEILETEIYESDKKIEDKITWTEDSQNVHDSNINNELKDQFDSIKKFNDTNDIYIWNFDDIICFIKDYSKEINDLDKKNIPDAIKMMEYINTHNCYVTKIDSGITLLMSHVFSYINTHEEKKRKVMIENLILNLKESYKNGTPVCITGQVTRILSSIADIDETGSIPGLGILKSKTVIKNEILAKAGNIRNNIVKSYPEDTQKKYNESISCKEVNELEDHIKFDIENMIKKDYYDLWNSDKQWINNIIKEIYSCI
jgi:hypothetical protein